MPRWSAGPMSDRWRRGVYYLIVAALFGALVYGVAVGGSSG